MSSYDNSATYTRCVTETKVEKGILCWTISDFNSYNMKPGQFLESSHFTAGSKDDTKWSLRLFPNGHSQAFKDYLSVFLKFHCNDENRSINAQSVVSIRNLVGMTFMQCRSEVKDFKAGNSFGFRVFPKRADLDKKILRKKKLHMRCEVSVFTKYKKTLPSDPDEGNLAPEYYLSSKLPAVFENKKFTDVTLKMEEQEIRAHKVILAAGSDVFLAMFNHDTIEKKSGIVDISDVRYEVMLKLVKFLYTGKVEDFGNSEELYAAANKYDIGPLRTMCEQHLACSLNVENVVHLIQFSDTYNALILKNRALSFAAFRIKDVQHRPEWGVLEDLSPRIALQVFKELSQNLKIEMMVQSSNDTTL